MQLTGQNNDGTSSSAFLLARKDNWLVRTCIMNTYHATCVRTQTSRLQPDWPFSLFSILWLVRVKYREGGIYGVYSPRGRAASEGCIRHKSRLSRYLTNLFYFWGGFRIESFDFKQFNSKFVEIFPQVWSNYLFKGCIWDTARGTSKKTDTKIK